MLEVLEHCRAVVTADATVMTGAFPSTLYTVVGKDANNHLVPAAFMLSWTSEQARDWVPFLRAVQPRTSHVQVCISDAAKGLINGISAAGWVHSRCALHMHRNMCQQRIAAGLRAKYVSTLAKQCRAMDFEYVLNTILQDCPPSTRGKTEEFLRRNQTQYSAVTFLPDYPRFGDVLNNAAEAFNSILVRASPGQLRPKDMGWISVMEALCACMQRWHFQRYAFECVLLNILLAR